LGTWQKCLAAAIEAFPKGKSVVVDNTNPDRESRQRFIDAAKKAKLPCRCFIMLTTFEHAKHNERVGARYSRLHDNVLPSVKVLVFKERFYVLH